MRISASSKIQRPKITKIVAENWIVQQPVDAVVVIDRQKLAAACYDTIIEVVGDKYQWILPFIYNEAVRNLNQYSDKQLLEKINRIVGIFDVYRIDLPGLVAKK